MEHFIGFLSASALALSIYLMAGWLTPTTPAPLENKQAKSYVELLLLTVISVAVMTLVLSCMWLLLRAHPRGFISVYRVVIFMSNATIAALTCQLLLHRFGAPPRALVTTVSSGLSGLLVVAPAFLWPSWFTTGLCASIVAVGLLIVISMVRFRDKIGLSLWHCAALLVGIVIYDVFAVFFTPMMEDVALTLSGTGSSLPIMISFPESLNWDAEPRFMLGLGDIVLPGIAVMIGFREARRYGRPALVIGPCLGYVVGMAATTAVMTFTHEPQPATLYLVPGVLAGLVIAARYVGRHREIWSLSRDVSPTPPPPHP